MSALSAASTSPAFSHLEGLAILHHAVEFHSKPRTPYANVVCDGGVISEDAELARHAKTSYDKVAVPIRAALSKASKEPAPTAS